MSAENINLDGLSEKEKLDIMQVLKRNEALQEREKRRLEQLAMRIQMERMGNERTIEDEREILTKTGLWHRILQSERRSLNLPDAASSLYTRIKAELTVRLSMTTATTSEPEIGDKIDDEQATTDDSSADNWCDHYREFSDDYVTKVLAAQIQFSDKHQKDKISTQFSFGMSGEVEQRGI